MIYLLIALAILINIKEDNALLLSLLVSLTILLPMQYVHSFNIWYFICVACETAIALSALSLNTTTSLPVCFCCTLMNICHLNGWVFNGYKDNSPYHVVLPYLEHIEIASCILFSKPIINKIKGKVKCLL